MFPYKKEQIAKSRKEAFNKIVEILSAGNVDDQFKHISGEYHSSDKFIVTWLGNYKGMGVEIGIDKCDQAYKIYSGGVVAIKARRNLFYEKQIGEYHSIERALIATGIELASTREEQVDFFQKYAVPYNEKLKKANF